MSVFEYCRPETSQTIVSLSPQPISNRFRSNKSEPEAKFPLALSQCRLSGAIYLSTNVPQEELVPRMDWLTYNEPEAHLDAMVDQLMGRCGLKRGDVVGGVSVKDDTTLRRFETLGLSSWRLDLETDLGIPNPGAGVESIQRELSPSTAASAVSRYGKARVLIVRHILEHVYDVPRFLDSLRAMVEPGGYIVFEVPDCTRALERFDYTTVWEEHLLYFTPATLRTVLARSGMPLDWFASYPYPFEDSLVVVLGNQSVAGASFAADEDLTKELDRGKRFGENFLRTGDGFRAALDKYAGRGPVALFGAGHLTSTFVGLFELAERFAFVIDDNPHKVGKLLPGTDLPIRPSSVLSETPLALCVLGLNPMNEQTILRKFSPIVTAHGGELRSIFPASSLYLLGSGA